jgi:hypothetical protein
MRAGYAAYYAAFSPGYFGANHKPRRQISPYSGNLQNKQWDKGWQIAQRNHETGKNFSHDPLKGLQLGYLGIDPAVKKREQQERQKKQAEFIARQKARQAKSIPVKLLERGGGAFRPVIKRGGTYHIDGKVHTPSVVPSETIPAINLRRIDKFNNKFRTKS